jgi:hypothetical protein
MSKNAVEPERTQMTIRRMRVAWWISKVTRSQAHARRRREPTPTHTHACTQPCACTRTELCNIYCFSTATVVT